MADELTWGEWEQPQLSFEDNIPSAQETINKRAEGAREQTDVFDYSVGLYQIPTATTDPERPRTVAAKYEPTDKAIYVVMRPYHMGGGSLRAPVIKYSPMSITDWRNFRAAYSKGRYILLNWDGKVDYEEVSSLGGFDQFLVTAVQYAQAQQQARDGLQAGQKETSDIYKKLRRAVADGRKVSDVRLRSDKLGGTGRTRQQKVTLEAAAESFYRNKP